MYFNHIICTIFFTVSDFRRLLDSGARFESRPNLLLPDPVERVGEGALNIQD
jgi:hypothetical protein